MGTQARFYMTYRLSLIHIWQPVEYPLWAVVEYEGAFYTLMTLEGFDYNLDPMVSDCWGAIADYDSSYNALSLIHIYIS